MVLRELSSNIDRLRVRLVHNWSQRSEKFTTYFKAQKATEHRVIHTR
jgi:hypothetical protein